LESTDFKEALDSIGQQSGNSAPEAVVVAVSGVAGGCGATTLAINLAYEVAQGRGGRTILAELSLQMGMIVTYLDFESKFGLDDLLSYPDGMDVHVIEKSLTRISDTLSILPGPRRRVPLSDTAQSKMAGILGYLKQLADVVVLDVPCTFDDAYFDFLRGADQVVLVGEQRIPAIRNVQLVLETLGHKEAEGKQHLVLNRYDPRLQGFTAADLEKLLHLPRVLTIANDAARVTAALNQGLPLQKAAPHSPVLADVKSLTRILFNLDEAPVRPAGSGVIRRLFQAVGLG
jgi:pilus assembly protein CpaE